MKWYYNTNSPRHTAEHPFSAGEKVAPLLVFDEKLKLLV